ncbi:MAG: recombinase family protein [Pseudomonadota bacterium]
MTKPLRCAIYTRKSTEEGLEQDFNSLDAQREACAAYVTSQRHEGWVELPTLYDDGGFSGGSMDRPALERLLAEIEAGGIDVVVVYKVDRLTRSLADFARIVAIFDAAEVSFVSVTQAFNTTTSMGRLTLNVLLSFAQFEREVTAERIRDKIAASKKKGMWMGGVPPLGYRAENRQLVVVPEEAELVRHIFRRYLELGSVRLLQAELADQGYKTPVRMAMRTGRRSGGCLFSKGKLYWVLSNPVLIGCVRHRDKVYDGQHEPILDRETWDSAQAMLAANRRCHTNRSRAQAPSPLAGKLFDPAGHRMRPVHAKKNCKRYRYYTSPGLIDSSRKAGASGWRIPGAQIEDVVAEAIRDRLSDPATRSALIGGVDEPTRVDALLTAIRRMVEVLHAPESPEGQHLLRRITRRVDLTEDQLTATIDLAEALADILSPDNDADLTLEISAPIRLDRRGAALQMILRSAAGDAASPEPNLIQTVVDARRRLAMYMDQANPKTISEIAATDSIDIADVSRSLQLAFLAPDLIETILDGRQPTSLSAHKLRRLDALPLLWEEQRTLLA